MLGPHPLQLVIHLLEPSWRYAMMRLLTHRPRMRYQLALFDFDGTLADSFPFFLSVFNTIADQHGFKRIDTSRAGELRHYGMRQMMDHVGMPAWKLPLASRTFMRLMKESA